MSNEGWVFVWMQVILLHAMRVSFSVQAFPFALSSYHPTSTVFHKLLKCRLRQPFSNTVLYQQQLTLADIITNESTTSTLSFYMAEEIEKKSRFIGIAKHVSSWTDAQHFITKIRGLHPKARHVCYAFVAGTHPVFQERSSDDGEPTGTAGQPILGAIKGEGLSDTLCIVVRYFGGIKLGAGGLIRAYGSCARLVLRQAPKIQCIPKSTFILKIPSSYSGPVYSLATKFSAVIGGTQYEDDGSVQIHITCDTDDLVNMMEDIRDATRGDVAFLN